MESNFITSLGETVNRYFQIYPSSSVVFAGDGSKSVNVGLCLDGLPFGWDPLDPFFIHK